MHSTGRKRKHRQAELEQLLRCVFDGEFDRVRELVEIQRVSVNCQDDDSGLTPLLVACFYGRVQIAPFLLEKDANIHAFNKDGHSAFALAVLRHANPTLAEVLLEHGANVETRISLSRGTSKLEYTVLGWAIRQNKVALVRLLLRFDASTEEIQVTPKSAFGALYRACLGRNVEIVQLLLHHGVDVNAANLRRADDLMMMSPLCLACERNCMEIAQLLVQQGARIIYDDGPENPCPLKHAIVNGSLELVRFLLDNYSPFSSSANNARHQEEVGDTHPLSRPLDVALAYNKLESAKLLVERGARVNSKSFLLWKCADYVRYEAACFLLRAGANVNLANSENGETPLWVAAYRGNSLMVEEFLKAQAHVCIPDKHGETPLGVAHRRGHIGVVYLLLRTSPHVWEPLAKAL